MKGYQKLRLGASQAELSPHSLLRLQSLQYSSGIAGRAIGENQGTRSCWRTSSWTREPPSVRPPRVATSLELQSK